jgi:hypothetical protein
MIEGLQPPPRNQSASAVTDDVNISLGPCKEPGKNGSKAGAALLRCERFDVKEELVVLVVFAQAESG